MRISDWSSDVCSSDLLDDRGPGVTDRFTPGRRAGAFGIHAGTPRRTVAPHPEGARRRRGARRAQDPDGRWWSRHAAGVERKSVMEGKRVSVRVDLGGARIVTKKHNE